MNHSPTCFAPPAPPAPPAHAGFALAALLGSIAFLLASNAYALEWEKTAIKQRADIGTPLPPYVFTCTNTGTATVTITGILPSCGCLAPALNKKTLASGESAKLSVAFDRTGYSGEVERTVKIVTDEPGSKSYQLVLRADLPEALTLAPRLRVWKVGEPAEAKSVDITINLPRPVVITRATSNLDEISATLVTLEAGRHYRLDITPRSTAKPRMAIITLQPAEPLPADTTLTVYAQVR